MPPKEPGGEPRKLFVHRTWLDGGWHYPSRRDDFASDWPAPRPLYRLPDLIDRPDAPVLISEGEKSADAAAGLFPDHACITWCGGTGGLNVSDWSVLTGRSVTLWPDADGPGRQTMAKLAQRLLPIASAVVVVKVPPALPDGWDLADAAAEGWTQARAAKVVERCGVPVEAPPPPPETPTKPPPPKVVDIPRGQPFACLGFDGDNFFYLPHSTGQVTRISRGHHTGTHLVSLYPSMGYWETLYPGGRSGVNWTAAAASLFAQQAAVGVYDRDYIRGRGAWLDDGRVIFHLGDRLIVDGKAHPVLKPPPTRYYYEHSRHLDGPGETPLSDDEAIRITAIAEQFRWEVPASAHFLTGWMVLAPVCGALNWRPHIWVTGGAGTGKTTILKAFMRPLMGGVLQTATGGTTEPGLRGILKSDAIPVVFDEFEQNEARDKAIVQNVLALARIASSEGGKIYKGTPTGGTNGFEIRSMFCVSSINVSLIQKADIDRFCVLGLRKDPMDKGQWLDFEREILSVATVENGRALIRRTLDHLPTIAQNARTLGQALGRRFGQRFGDQHGTLLAGAWSLEAGGGGLLTLDTADQWIASMDWDHQQHDATDSDELKCRDTILQQIVRYGGGLDASLGEMVHAIATQQSLGRTPWTELVPILGRYGLKVFREGEKHPDGQPSSGHFLAVANGNAQLDQLLRTTPWSNGAHRSALRRITGALTPGKPTHFAGIGAKRSTLIPITPDDLFA
jgi:putative DNA primase/helicase